MLDAGDGDLRVKRASSRCCWWPSGQKRPRESTPRRSEHISEPMSQAFT